MSIKDSLFRLFGRHSAATETAQPEDRPSLDKPKWAARSLLDWTWDRRETPQATPEEIVWRYGEFAGYKPTSELTSAELQGMSRERAVICEALEDIRSRGDIMKDAGEKLRFLSENGVAPPVQSGAPTARL